MSVVIPHDSTARSPGIHPNTSLRTALLGLALAGVACGDPSAAFPTTTPVADTTRTPAAEPVTLQLDTWLSEVAWVDAVIPAFEAAHPGIRIELNQIPGSDYDETIAGDLAAGTAGDLVTCRSYDRSLRLHEAGHLAPVTDVVEAAELSPLQVAPFATDDGATVFCVPIAAVVHGWAYNLDVIGEVGGTLPTTASEFTELLQLVADDGRYQPMAIGLSSPNQAVTMLWYAAGPPFWGGETGRLELIGGSSSFSDQGFVDALEHLAGWGPTFPDDPRTVDRIDGIEAFIGGEAAVAPVGSWESRSLATVEFELAVSPSLPTEPGGACSVTHHGDFGIAISAGADSDAARSFVTWLFSDEFAEAFFEIEPGFVSITRGATSDLPLPRTFASWTETCDVTGRLFEQVLLRDRPNLLFDAGEIIASVIAGETAPAAASSALDALLQE